MVGCPVKLQVKFLAGDLRTARFGLRLPIVECRSLNIISHGSVAMEFV